MSSRDHEIIDLTGDEPLRIRTTRRKFIKVESSSDSSYSPSSPSESSHSSHASHSPPSSPSSQSSQSNHSSQSSQSSALDENQDEEEDEDQLLVRIKNYKYDPTIGLDYENRNYLRIITNEHLEEVKDEMISSLAKQVPEYKVDDLDYYGVVYSENPMGLMCNFDVGNITTNQTLSYDEFEIIKKSSDDFTVGLKGKRILNENHTANYRFYCDEEQKYNIYINWSVREQLLNPYFFKPRIESENKLFIPNMPGDDVEYYAEQLATIMFGQSGQIRVNRVTNVTISLLAQIRFAHIKEFIRYAWERGGLHKEEDRDVLLKILGRDDEVDNWHNHVQHKLN